MPPVRFWAGLWTISLRGQASAGTRCLGSSEGCVTTCGRATAPRSSTPSPAMASRCFRRHGPARGSPADSAIRIARLALRTTPEHRPVKRPFVSACRLANGPWAARLDPGNKHAGRAQGGVPLKWAGRLSRGRSRPKNLGRNPQNFFLTQDPETASTSLPL